MYGNSLVSEKPLASQGALRFTETSISNSTEPGNHSSQPQSILTFSSPELIQWMQTCPLLCPPHTSLQSSGTSRQLRTSETTNVSAVNLRLAYAATSPTTRLSGSVHDDHRRMSNLKVYCFTTQKRAGFLNPLKLELKPSAQRCLTRFLYWGFYFLNRSFR
jgi:hypothetical protein